MSEINFVDEVNGEIRIKCDPELARDLVFVLSALLDVARMMRTKLQHARACSTDPTDLEARLKVFNEKSLAIFNRFQSLRDGPCNGDRAAALQSIKQEFNLGYGEAKIYVIEGRKLLKKRDKMEKHVSHQ